MDTEAHHQPLDIDPADADMGRAVVRGVIIGGFAGFVGTLVIALVADTGWRRSLQIAVWPAIVGGPFFGGVVAVGRFMAREERREAALHAASRQAAVVPRDARAEHALVSEPGAAAPPATTGPALDLAAGAVAIGHPIAMDDLEVVEGIGPKIAELLDRNGITTWADLAGTDAERLHEILVDAGPQYRLSDPTTWPRQAALLAAGRWTEFQDLTDALDGGRYTHRAFAHH